MKSKATKILLIALHKSPILEVAECFNFCLGMQWVWTNSIYIAFVLIFWIQIEIVLLNAVSWLHTFYMFLAVLIIFVAVMPQIRN